MKGQLNVTYLFYREWETFLKNALIYSIHPCFSGVFSVSFTLGKLQLANLCCSLATLPFLPCTVLCALAREYNFLLIGRASARLHSATSWERFSQIDLRAHCQPAHGVNINCAAKDAQAHKHTKPQEKLEKGGGGSRQWEWEWKGSTGARTQTGWRTHHGAFVV